MTATAGPRRPPRRAWTASRNGQVAMTIIVAQTTAATNGSMTQRLAKVMAPMARTPRVMRGRSNDGGGGGFPAGPSGVVTRHPPGAPSLRERAHPPDPTIPRPARDGCGISSRR